MGGLGYATWAFRRWPHLASRVRGEIEQSATGEAAGGAERQPSLALSFLPIVLPIVLIAGRTVVAATGLTGTAATVATFFGDPNVALFLALLVTMYLLVSTRGTTRTIP